MLKYIVCVICILIALMQAGKIGRNIFDMKFSLKALFLPVSSDVKAYNMKSALQDVKHLVVIAVCIIVAIAVIVMVM